MSETFKAWWEQASPYHVPLIVCGAAFVALLIWHGVRAFYRDV